MKVVSVNITKFEDIQTLPWRGKSVRTGLIKKPVPSIQLGFEDVVDDNVIDRKYHGGIDQACYLYGTAQYDYWRELYPDIDWQFGMLGENVTIDGLDESKMLAGALYQLGTAEVVVTKPRLPCYKLGIIMGTQSFLKVFWLAPYPGVYLKVKKVGIVKPGDEMILLEENKSGRSILEQYRTKKRNKFIV